MNIFIAGGSGAIGRFLVPLLVKAGHRVVALTRAPDRCDQLARMGAQPVVGDVYDEAALARIVRDARPEVVMHQLTAFGEKDGYASTIKVRIDGTRSLVAAARAAGARRVIAQSISFVCTPHGEGLTDEETPLYLDAPAEMRPLVEAVASLERQTLESGMAGTVLRYGWFYGPGTTYDPAGLFPTAIRAGKLPLAGSGAGMYSFISLEDAAAATMKALEHEAGGIYNIVEDEPARWGDWLSFAAQLLGAPPPGRQDEADARKRLGDMRTYFMNEQRGASNAKARRGLGWQPSRTWRAGFEALYRQQGTRR